MARVVTPDTVERVIAKSAIAGLRYNAQFQFPVEPLERLRSRDAEVLDDVAVVVEHVQHRVMLAGACALALADESAGLRHADHVLAALPGVLGERRGRVLAA